MLEALTLLTRYSQLVECSNEALTDQLKLRKLQGATGFTVTQSNRTAYVLQLQTLMLTADADANDLPPAESGIEGRNIKRKARAADSSKRGSDRRKRKAPPGEIEYMGHFWTKEEADFEVEALAGKVVADGTCLYVNQGKVRKGMVLYRVVWKGFPPDMMWYEPCKNLRHVCRPRLMFWLRRRARMQS